MRAHSAGVADGILLPSEATAQLLPSFASLSDVYPFLSFPHAVRANLEDVTESPHSRVTPCLLLAPSTPRICARS